MEVSWLDGRTVKRTMAVARCQLPGAGGRWPVAVVREGNAKRLAVKHAVFLLVNPNKGGAFG